MFLFPWESNSRNDSTTMESNPAILHEHSWNILKCNNTRKNRYKCWKYFLGKWYTIMYTYTHMYMYAKMVYNDYNAQKRKLYFLRGWIHSLIRLSATKERQTVNRKAKGNWPNADMKNGQQKYQNAMLITILSTFYYTILPFPSLFFSAILSNDIDEWINTVVVDVIQSPYQKCIENIVKKHVRFKQFHAVDIFIRLCDVFILFYVLLLLWVWIVIGRFVVVVSVTYILFVFIFFTNKRQESPIKIDSTFFDSIKSMYFSSFSVHLCLSIDAFHFNAHFEWIWFDILILFFVCVFMLSAL